AKKQSISYRTALRWFHGGTSPVEAEQLSAGTIIVKVETVLEDKMTAAASFLLCRFSLKINACLNLRNQASINSESSCSGSVRSFGDVYSSEAISSINGGI